MTSHVLDGEMRDFNPHFLHVLSGIAENSQLATCLEKAIKDVSKKLRREVMCEFKTNLIHIPDRETGQIKPVGYGYLWVSNPEVYYMLTGLNPDGSARVKVVPDMTWVDPPYRKEQTLEEIHKEFQCGTSWAEINEKEFEEEARHIRPTVEVPLPPLMKVQPFQYTDEQKEKYPGKESDEFVFSGAHVGRLEVEFCHHTLCSARVPNWMTYKQLKDLFTPFTTDSKTVITRKKGRSTFEFTYPMVNITNRGIAFITFDSRTQDARFALLMTRRTELTSDDGKKKCVIQFNQSRVNPN